MKKTLLALLLLLTATLCSGQNYSEIPLHDGKPLSLEIINTIVQRDINSDNVLGLFGFQPAQYQVSDSSRAKVHDYIYRGVILNRVAFLVEEGKLTAYWFSGSETVRAYWREEGYEIDLVYADDGSPVYYTYIKFN